MTSLICGNPERRQQLLRSDLDGIDAIEVPFDDQTHIRVYFVKGPPPAVDASNVHVEGGVRIRDIDVLAVSTATDGNGEDHLVVTVDRAGDFSPYLLRIDAPGVLDPVYDHGEFGFKVGCPSDFDCLDGAVCPPEPGETPVIDYMAKDYASFRQLLIDLIPAKVPEWTDRHEADLGMTLIELLAYEGDHISYAQDAVAQEMHLETARQRESVARHVRLIDYRMHHGSNAKAFVQLTVQTAGTVPAGSLRCPERTVRFLTRIGEPIDPASPVPPGSVIAHELGVRALAATDAAFEPVDTTHVDPVLNEVPIHTWGNTDCCLPVGTTTVDLVGEVPLRCGDLLLLEEVRGVRTGLPQDADPTHRQVVRISALGEPGTDTPLQDPLYTLDPDADGGVGPREATDDPLPVTRVHWDPQDALRFPLCVSTTDLADNPVPVVAVARGNVVLVDHGVTATEQHVPDESRIRYSRIGYRFRLDGAPLTFGFGRDFVAGGPVAELQALSPRAAAPQVVVIDGNGAGFTWLPEPDLLGSDPFSRSFVAEPDHGGRALIRFGDGTFGRQPSFPELPEDSEESRLVVHYRVGNGRQGNVGRDTVVHLLEAEQPSADAPVVRAVRNPLPASGGEDYESIDQVKRLAPDAYRAESYRAVTADDYARAAELLPLVSHGQASFRWTGSWHTVFTTVDPVGTDTLSPATEAVVRNHLSRYKLAGYDLEIDPPQYVALEIGVVVCAALDHFRADVGRAVRDALSAGTRPDGSRGFFHPDNFTFGQPLHLSRVYAAVESVPGVDSAEVVTFQRYGVQPSGELAAGRIAAGRLEVLRLDNDPNFPEHGVLHLDMRGGK
ncbi:hypothetical protein [Geodermatophilus sp. URMC 60]